MGRPLSLLSLEMFFVESSHQMLWPSNSDTLRELTIVLITQTQVIVVVASERVDLVTVKLQVTNARSCLFDIITVANWSIVVAAE